MDERGTEDGGSCSRQSKNVNRFNALSKGRCSDKMLAMKHVCGLSDLQYEILCDKWCAGRRGYTRSEIAYRRNVSERTIDREYADAREKILAVMHKYNQETYSGRFFFELDMELTGYDWSDKIKD